MTVTLLCCTTSAQGAKCDVKIFQTPTIDWYHNPLGYQSQIVACNFETNQCYMSFIINLPASIVPLRQSKHAELIKSEVCSNSVIDNLLEPSIPFYEKPLVKSMIQHCNEIDALDFTTKELLEYHTISETYHYVLDYFYEMFTSSKKQANQRHLNELRYSKHETFHMTDDFVLYNTKSLVVHIDDLFSYLKSC